METAFIQGPIISVHTRQIGHAHEALDLYLKGFEGLVRSASVPIHRTKGLLCSHLAPYKGPSHNPPMIPASSKHMAAHHVSI